ncbi:myrosinase 1-like [Thrips palmi]|uniref:beta-glucosidase n=1 Tax=Thrips palmi TaxID=161013 RepID=A0A6P8ZX10_THRPL|nr:myrosinase 1-like [Thrips palmi]
MAMARAVRALPWLAVLAVALCGGAALEGPDGLEDPFAVPEGLLIGAGVSAIQTEGAWDEDGKGESAADHLLHIGKLSAFGFGNDSREHDVAADSYHRYKEDVRAAAQLGLKLYRFSISWSRVLPDAVTRNEKGVQYYHRLIDEVLKYNMTPMVTLYHFDHPWILEDQFKGWQSEKMVDYFKEFARLAFSEYAGKAKLWITINEANNYCTYFPNLYQKVGLYADGDMDPFTCMRHTILAHAEAYHLFKEAGHEGQVGFSALVFTARPNSTRPEDVYSADAFNQVAAGVLLNPVVHGDYPELFKRLAGSNLQPFSDAQKRRIKGTADFLACNVYFGIVAAFTTADMTAFSKVPILGQYLAVLPFVSPSVVGTDLSHMSSMFSVVTPDAMRSAVVWAWNEYRLPLVISENGFGDIYGLGKKDRLRGVYHSLYLRSLVSTMKEFSIKVIGYCTWSLIDSFEWSAGYSRPFGLVHVDYEGGSLDRSMKDSSQFWIDLARTGSVPLWEEDTASSASSTATSATLLLLLAMPAYFLSSSLANQYISL